MKTGSVLAALGVLFCAMQSQAVIQLRRFGAIKDTFTYEYTLVYDDSNGSASSSTANLYSNSQPTFPRKYSYTYNFGQYYDGANVSFYYWNGLAWATDTYDFGSQGFYEYMDVAEPFTPEHIIVDAGTFHLQGAGITGGAQGWTHTEPEHMTVQPVSYDMSGIVHEYNELEDCIVSLMYKDPDTGQWVTIDGRYIEGKASPLDPPRLFEWSEYVLPEGVVEWQMGYEFGHVTEFEGIPDTMLDEHGTIHLQQVEDGVYSGGGFTEVMQLPSPVGNITKIWSGNESTTQEDAETGELASGLDNVPASTNEAYQAAVDLAAGIRLAKSDLQGAFGDALGDSELGDIAEGMAAVQGAVDGLQDYLSNTNGLAMSGDLSGDVSSNQYAAAAGEVDTAESALDFWGGELSEALTVAPITPVYSMQYSLGGQSGTISWDWPELDLIHEMLEWMVHVIMIFGILATIRKGIA